MKIKKITWQHRNDFYAIMECEHCGKEKENKCGYDDDYYHDRVIPAMHCPDCKKNRAGEVEVVLNTST